MPNLYDGFDTAGKEISSTYEGRHITLYESLWTHPSHTDGFVDAKDPVVCGNIVGVALVDGAAATDQISVDTEGIWALSVVATDQDGNSAIAVGDEIFINKTTAILSKNYDLNVSTHFGYALMSAVAGTTDVIAVKVHWDPSSGDEEVQVGSAAVPYELGAELIGREYRYQSEIDTARAMYIELDQDGAATSMDCLRPRIMIGAVAVAGSWGIHAGLEFSEAVTGRVTGLAGGGRFTYFANNRGQSGTICGGMSELYAAGTSTDFGAATVHSIHRFVMDGDPTGYATGDNVFEFVNLSAVQYAANTDTPDHALRCIINGNVRYIMVSEAQS